MEVINALIAGALAMPVSGLSKINKAIVIEHRTAIHAKYFAMNVVKNPIETPASIARMLITVY